MRGPRAQVYLANAIKNWLSFRHAEDFNLSEDFKFEYRSDGSNWVLVSIKDPSSNVPDYFEVRITHKAG